MKTYIIGRDPKADITINDAINSISRTHAELAVHSDGSVTLEDLESTNGILINGRRLNPRQPFYLQPGDEVILAGRLAFNWEQYVSIGALFPESEEVVPETAAQRAPIHTPHIQEESGWEVPVDEPESPPKQMPPKPAPKEKEKRATFRKSMPSEGISGTIIGDFFDRVIPIPALSRSIQLFFSLHRKPLLKITNLVRDEEQVEGVPYVHPFNFLGVSVAFFFLSTLVIKKTVEKTGGVDSANSLDFFFDDASLIAVFIAVVAFLYAWIGYGVFKRTSKIQRSFRKYLMLNSLTTGMTYSYYAILLIIVGVFGAMGGDGNESATMVLGIAFIVWAIMIMYFAIVNLRATRRFWKMSWGKFLLIFSLVTLLSSLPYLLLGMLAGSM